MKPFTIMFEVSQPLIAKPGYFKNDHFKDGYFKRIWWLWFGITIVRMDLYDYNSYIRSNQTEWKP